MGQRGYKLSGGERQRLGIARAMLRRSQILIFDEASSEIDAESDRHIGDAIRGLKVSKTVIIIAHRLATAITADLIVVMDCGKIVAQGKHKELFSSCRYYRDLCSAQFIKKNDRFLYGYVGNVVQGA